MELLSIIDLLTCQSTDIVAENIAGRITRIQERLLSFLKGITRYQRSAASHVLITILSPSSRNVKPYAIPISCIPYARLRLEFTSMR